MLTENRPAATYLLLIRHGENEWVSSGRLAGRTPGVHLNEKGTAQAARLAELLAAQPIQAIYSSPLERCVETAQPLAARLNLPVHVEAGVSEVDYGSWHGQELKELSQRPEWHAVQHFPSTFRFPGGESLREVQHRAIDALERIAEVHPNQTVAVFSHGDVIRTVLAHYAGTAIDLFQRVHVSTASVSVVGLFGGRPAVITINYTADLPVFEIKTEQEKSGDESPAAADAPPAEGEGSADAARGEGI